MPKLCSTFFLTLFRYMDSYHRCIGIMAQKISWLQKRWKRDTELSKGPIYKDSMVFSLNYTILMLCLDWSIICKSTNGYGQKCKFFFLELETHHGLDSQNSTYIWLLHYLFFPLSIKMLRSGLQYKTHILSLSFKVKGLSCLKKSLSSVCSKIAFKVVFLLLSTKMLTHLQQVQPSSLISLVMLSTLL